VSEVHGAPADVDLGGLYRSARQRITGLLTGGSGDLGRRPVPATPSWTVHDVIAHLRGVVEDALRGNTAGVATDPWTAAQVERHRGTTLADLLAQWAAEAPLVEAFLSSPDGARAERAVIDVHTHEADLRGALGLPPELPAPYGPWMVARLAAGVIDACASSGLPPLRIETVEGDAAGPATAEVVLRISRHELHRAVLGRRSREQVVAYDWRGADPAPYAANLAVFGPRTEPLDD